MKLAAEAGLGKVADLIELSTACPLTCTNNKNLLHRYEEFSPSKPCPVSLAFASVEAEKITPIGRGYLRVPALNNKGYVEIKAYYSPLLTRSLLSQWDFLSCEGSECDYSHKSLLMDEKQCTFLDTYHHSLRKSQVVQACGFIFANALYFQPLVASKTPSSADHV